MGYTKITRIQLEDGTEWTGEVDVDVADGDNVTLGSIDDAIVDAGATGSVSAKLRRISQGVEDLKTSIVPGTEATSLGKAEDAAHASGDVGVMALAVRQDVPNTLADTDGDYIPLSVDQKGRLHPGVPVFGEPTLLASRNADAVWSRGGVSPLFQKSSTGWLANLYGGVQSGDDFAAVYIPVNEMAVTDLTSAMWSYYLTQAQSGGVNMVVWVHDPTDFDKRAEITQVMGLVEHSEGWDAHELDTSVSQFFFYGEGVSGNTTCTTAGTNYTWAQYQADAMFSTWTIYRISFEYGWVASGTFADAWVADIKINGIQIPLKPDAGGTGRIGRRHFTCASGDLSGSLAPKTPFRILSLLAHCSAVPQADEDITLTLDAGQGTLYDALLFSSDMHAADATSLFTSFEFMGMFGADDEIDLFQTNSNDDDWGAPITYQTVFEGGL